MSLKLAHNFIGATSTLRYLYLGLPIALLLSVAPKSVALEVLPAKELAEHCALLESEPEGVDGQYCIRYIQGFIDGAIATDARVMLNAVQETTAGETFLERAKRTRLPGRLDLDKAARLAGFCLGEPLQLKEIVAVVVADLTAITGKSAELEPAMEAVYQSLVHHYPCTK